MFKLGLVLVCVSFYILRSEGHSYSLGSCPTIEPLTPFDMHRMLGMWYVIQKTSTASTCISYNFTKLEEPDNFQLEQISQHLVLRFALKHEYRYTGHLVVPDPSVPGKMTVKFPLNPLGKASFTVFMTDYDNYAAIYTCQGFGIGHRDSATILSRTRTLDKLYVDKIRTRLESYNINPFDLSIISQKDCPKNKDGNNGLNIDIDQHTFSAENIAGVVKKAGEKIGDGIEYVAGGAKKIYNTYAVNHDTYPHPPPPPEGSVPPRNFQQEDLVEYITNSPRHVYSNVGPNDKLTDGTGKALEFDPDDASEWLP